MWDERYGAPEYVYGTEPNEFLASVASRIPLGRVLSLADGEGRNGVFLATLGHRVTSVDASPVGLAKAGRLAAARGVTLTTIVADLAEYAIAPGGWEGIVSIFCHLPPPLRRRVHEQVVRGLAPGGMYVLEAYSVRQLQFGTERRDPGSRAQAGVAPRDTGGSGYPRLPWIHGLAQAGLWSPDADGGAIRCARCRISVCGGSLRR
jgi:SAM-dependent methyltransferase